MSITFYHLADIHLDRPFTTLSDKVGFPEIRRRELLSVFLEVLQRAKQQKPDFILICGDLYEHNHSKITTIERINRAFAQLDSHVVLLPGNHDPYVKNSFYNSFNWADNVYIFGEDRPYIQFDDKNTRIYGIAYDGGGGQKLQLDNMHNIDKRYTNILMMHGDLDLKISRYHNIQSQELLDMGFDYTAMGHSHKRFINQNIFNPGSLCSLSFDQKDSTGYYYVDMHNSTVSFEKVSDRKHLRLSLDELQMRSFMQNYPEKRDIYNITVLGEREEMQQDSDFLLPQHYYSQGYDYVRIKDRRRAKKHEEIHGLKEVFRNIMHDKILKAGQEQDNDSELLQLALKYGLLALDNRDLEV